MLIVAVVVLVPLWVELIALRKPREAEALAARSAQVQTEVLQFARELRRLESQLFTQLLGVAPATGAADFTGASERLLEKISHLRGLTSDNPRQQERLRKLQAHIVARLSALDRARISAPNVARDLIARSNAASAHVQIVDAIVAEEQRLLLQRRGMFAKNERAAQTVAIGAAIAQCALLLLLMLLAERDRLRCAKAATETDVERGRAASIVASVPTPIALLSTSLEVVQANPAFVALSGNPGSALEGRPLSEVAQGSWNDPMLLQRLGDVAHLGRELWDYETTQLDADQRARTLLLNARRLGSDQADLVLLTAIDITASRRRDEQVRELNRQLTGKVDQVSEVNRELEAFSYSVSHDLRAPLRHIAAFAGKLRGEVGLEPGEKTRHYLDVIDESSRRMSQLIDDLLVYSRLGRSAMRNMPLDMQSIVQDVRAMLSSDAGAHRVQWDIGQLPVVEGDENMLRTVWQNLLGNAIKYSSPTEVPRVRVRAEPDPINQEWVFSVADNGVGFDMAYVDKLFGVFHRLHKASDFPGTGIGLANVRRIVTRHQGRVWAEGAPGAGATFCFTLPTVAR